MRNDADRVQSLRPASFLTTQLAVLELQKHTRLSKKVCLCYFELELVNVNKGRYMIDVVTGRKPDQCQLTIELLF